MKGNSQVVIVDSRPEWMKKEDRVMACLTRCPVARHCSVRLGADCKHLGGTEIPRINRAVRKGKGKRK